MDRARREAWIRECLVTPKCRNNGQLDAIIEGAPEGPERSHAEQIQAAASLKESALRYGKDGETVHAQGLAMMARVIDKRGGLELFKLLTPTSAADASKDPESARGAALKVAGTVIEIRTEKGITEGALLTGNRWIVRFVTAMPSANIYAGTWASFVGVFVQEFAYPNVSGGQTRSLLVVGAFDIPANRSR